MTNASEMPRKLTILGSTGSIGSNTLDVVRQLGGRGQFEIVALTGAGNIALLAEQARQFGAELAVPPRTTTTKTSSPLSQERA